MRAVNLGAQATGIRLNASCAQFDVVPPALYEGFKKAVFEAAKNWGLTVSFGQDDGSIAAAHQRFWQQQRAHELGAAKADG